MICASAPSAPSTATTIANRPTDFIAYGRPDGDYGTEMREAQASIERSLAVHAAAANEPVQTPAANEAAQAPSPEPHSGAPESSPQLELGIEEPPQAASRDRASG